MYRIMLVEDDCTITGVLERQLKKWDCLVYAVTDFDTVAEQFLEYQPQLVLLDVSLPYYNGYHWCRELRKLSRVPIVFISSASDDMSLVMALDLGADDFIVKPFSLEVITAKLQAILRRTYDLGGDPEVLEHHGVTLSLGDAVLTYGEGRLELTKNEFKIMETLLRNKGSIVTREALMQRLWESESFIDDNTLTVNVTRLRKRLEGLGLENFILTKKGVGYLVEAAG